MTDSRLKVLFVYSDRFCSCSFKRSFEIAQGLFRYHSNAIDVQLIFFENLNSKTFSNYDVIVFQRLGANAGVLTQEFKNNLKKWIEKNFHRCQFIYDIDDFLFFRQKSTPVWLAQLCHSALVPTEYLCKEMSRYQITHIIRTHVDLEKIEKAPPLQLRGPEGKFQMGWFTTCAYGIDLINHTLNELKSLNQQINIHLFCSSTYHEYIKSHLNHYNLFLYPMVSSTEMYGYLKEMDCLINPLSSPSIHESTLSLQKDQFEKLIQSKAEIKYALAGAIKLPLIVTPNDAYKMAIQDGFNGYLAATSAEWIEKIRYVVAYPEKAKLIGERAHKDVQNRYSLKRAANDYFELFSTTRLR